MKAIILNNPATEEKETRNPVIEFWLEAGDPPGMWLVGRDESGSKKYILNIALSGELTRSHQAQLIGLECDIRGRIKLRESS
jgi:hypothetical protein